MGKQQKKKGVNRRFTTEKTLDAKKNTSNAKKIQIGKNFFRPYEIKGMAKEKIQQILDELSAQRDHKTISIINGLRKEHREYNRSASNRSRSKGSNQKAELEKNLDELQRINSELKDRVEFLEKSIEQYEKERHMATQEPIVRRSSGAGSAVSLFPDSSRDEGAANDSSPALEK